MESIKLSVKSRCDMHLCRNVAEYRIGGIYLCRDCLRELYEAIGKVVIPKSPENLIKKAVKRREENERIQG